MWINLLVVLVLLHVAVSSSSIKCYQGWLQITNETWNVTFGGQCPAYLFYSDCPSDSKGCKVTRLNTNCLSTQSQPRPLVIGDFLRFECGDSECTPCDPTSVCTNQPGIKSPMNCCTTDNCNCDTFSIMNLSQ